MTIPSVGMYNDVPPHTPFDYPSCSSGVCRCGAVFDYGNVAVPAEFAGMCGRCAFKRGLRLGTARHVFSGADSRDPRGEVLEPRTDLTAEGRNS
jgi:hypothetical protein